MYIRAFVVTPAVKELKHWADPAYAYAVGKNWPVLGYSSTTNRNKAVTRGFVAQIISSSQGLNLDETSSVQFLLNENLSAGKTSATSSTYKDVSTKTGEDTVLVFGVGSERYVTYEDNVTPGESAYDMLCISKATDKARDIAYKILETLGVKITPEIKKAIEDAPNLSPEEVKEIRIENSNVDISIRPSKYNEDIINISV